MPADTAPIDPDQSWTAFVGVAEDRMRSGYPFESPIRKQRYRVQSVLPDRVTILRVDANEPAVVTRSQVERALQRVRDAGGRVSRNTLSGTVAEETAMVELHPALRWSLSHDAIELTGQPDTRPLRLYTDYSRREVHDVFAPGTPFYPQTGTWGLHGIIPVPDRPGDFVFFVTFGQSQGEHIFDEGVTEDGVLTWQSQPRQGRDHPQIRAFIEHDESLNSIYLFLRAQARVDYTYLGQLKYLSHDRERENPVHFKWQILPETIPADVARRIGLTLQPSEPGHQPAPAAHAGLVEMPPPPVEPRGGETTPTFKRRKTGDYGMQDQRNRVLGEAGEKLVLDHERSALRAAGRPDLADQVRHTAAVEGDGAGYDIQSFTPEGVAKYIEVKTTRGPAATPFFMSRNELNFGRLHASQFFIHRVYDYDQASNSGRMYVVPGNPESAFEFTPTELRVWLKAE